MANRIVVGSSCAAALVAVMAAAASAQIAPRSPSPTQSPVQQGTQSPAGERSRPLGERSVSQQQVTILGCVANESDYKDGQTRSPAAGARESSGDEFVLVNAVMAPVATASASSSLGGSSTPSATGTSGSSADGAAAAVPETPARRGESGAAFSLTGDRESELSAHVGQRVEIVGTMDRDTLRRAESSDAAASGPAAAIPRVTILSFKPATGSCQ